MSWGRTVLSITILGATVAGFTTFNTQTQHQFYYYPDLNVYYDLQANAFLYSVDSGASWSLMNTSGRLHDLGKKIMVSCETAEIWRLNKDHISRYGGVQINLLKTMQWKAKSSGGPQKIKLSKSKTSKELRPDSPVAFEQGLDSAELKLRDEILKEQAIADTTQAKRDSFPVSSDTARYF